MKLTQDEINEIKRLVQNYRQISNRCDIMQEQLERLKIDLDLALIEKNETKRDEVIFIADLKEKYGDEVITSDLLKEIALC